MNEFMITLGCRLDVSSHGVAADTMRVPYSSLHSGLPTL